MLRRDYFAHGNFPGRMAAFHVSGSTAGENLAWGSGPYGTAGAVLLRASFTRIGLGVVRGTFLGTGDATVVTADFAGG
jgi:uncharacterized protein YkwD